MKTARMIIPELLMKLQGVVMKTKIYLALTLVAVCSSGCIMVNATSDISLLKYRSKETKLHNATGNTTSDKYESEGGGKLDATIPTTLPLGK